MSIESLSPRRLAQCIFDAVAAKRVLKTGYVRQPGGLYPTQCDTVAAHNHTVSVLAIILAMEVREALKEMVHVEISLDDVALSSIFHDYGEAKSGDTGATSNAVYGVCKLYGLERDGLQASLSGLRIEERAMRLYDDYRRYNTPESIIVHIADNLEGFEKAIHSSWGMRSQIDNAMEALAANISLYHQKKQQNDAVGQVANYLVDTVLIPGARAVLENYGLDLPIPN